MFCHQDVKGAFAPTANKCTGQGDFSADRETLKLDNQKNVWKGVCVYQ